MNKKITVGTSIALIFFAVLLAFTATYVFLNKSYQSKMDKYLEYSNKYEKLYNFDNIVREEYIGAVDEESVIDGMLDGYLNGLGDKYANYMNSEEYARYELEMSGKTVGIGITEGLLDLIKVFQLHYGNGVRTVFYIKQVFGEF